MLKTGDKVTHRDYPSIVGQVVFKQRPKYVSIPVFLVKWEGNVGSSHHIENALVRCK
jgi:hypothetical protein